MEIAIMIEGQMGVNWDNWRPLVRAVEDLGFAGLYRSDHFTNPNPPEMCTVVGMPARAAMRSTRVERISPP